MSSRDAAIGKGMERNVELLLNVYSIDVKMGIKYNGDRYCKDPDIKINKRLIYL